MRKDTIKSRGEGLGRGVDVRATVSVTTVIRLEGLAKQQGISRSKAVEEAIRFWCMARERSLNRQRRLEVEKAMREAADQKPIAELLERFRAQMESVGEEPTEVEDKDLAGGLTSVAPSASLEDMALVPMRKRREALGLTRQQLAALADCSLSMLQMLEGGYTPSTGQVVGRVEKALAEAEQKAAAA